MKFWKQSDNLFIQSSLTPLETRANDSAEGCEAFQIEQCDDALLVALRGQPRRFALVASPRVEARVNGSLAVDGLRVLNHQDELTIGSLRLFFSAESIPTPEVYQSDGARRPRCPICRAEIQDGLTVVRCPGCSRLYHQHEATGDEPAKPCWTYSPTCRFCQHPTALSGETTWRPDEEQLA